MKDSNKDVQCAFLLPSETRNAIKSKLAGKGIRLSDFLRLAIKKELEKA